jgi:tetratricopeptide (TPR) repeat protein
VIEEKVEIKKTLKSNKETSDVNIEEYKKHKKLSEEEKSRLTEIIKKVKVHSQKSYFDSAKALIIEGLAIDKFNKDLNLELARIYEEEKNYKNAEYIYRDIVDVVKNNDDILKKLGYILALQKKFTDSIDIYEKLFHKNAADMEVVELLTDLHYEVGNYEHSMRYVILSLKEKPRNVERLIMKADLLKREAKIEEAMLAYKQVLELQPYNTEARQNLREYENAMK